MIRFILGAKSLARYSFLSVLLMTLVLLSPVFILLLFTPTADAKCGGASRGRLFGGRFAERRSMRHNSVTTVTYSRSTYMVQPVHESCQPAQMPKKK